MSHSDNLPLSLALPDSRRARPQWMTSPRAWGARLPFAPAELGAWIWAPDAMCIETFELVAQFELPTNRGVIGAYCTGAARGAATCAIVAINGIVGTALGALETGTAGYRGFEGELSPWLRDGINTISMRVKDADAKGCALRLLVRYADGGCDEIRTDASWRARAWDGELLATARMIMAPPPSTSFGEAAPVQTLELGAIEVPRLYPQAWPAPLLRRDFNLELAPRKAVLTVCGLGCHEAYINGQRVGDGVLDPAQTTYETRGFFVTHDVTALLQSGPNALGLMIGHGWYGQNLAWAPTIAPSGKPAALVQLEIEDASGVRVIQSDADWRTTDGPIRADNLYRGEVFDARLERADWCIAGQTDGWENVEIVAPLTPRLEAQTLAPMRRKEEIKPVELSQPKPGTWVFDVGENIVGWAKLRVAAPSGTRVRLRFAEALHADGTLDFFSTGTFATRIVQQDEYVCRSGELEVWEPRFTYHGFQYVEVSGLSEPPNLKTITGVVVHTDLPPAGRWKSSDETLNAIEKLSRRSLVGNLHGIISDCPHRERCQWQADAEIIADYALYRYQSAPLLAKCLDDSAGTLDARGLPQEINVGRRLLPLRDIGWSTLHVQTAWRIYLFAGDLAPTRAHYDLMSFVCDYYHDLHPDGIVPGAAHGDHAAPPFTHQGEPLPECPRDAYATILLFESTQTLSQLTKKLGRAEDAHKYETAANRVRRALLARFYDARSGGFAHPTLDAYALLLGLYPDGERASLAEHFRAALGRHDWMNVGGFFGYRRIAEAAILHLLEAEALQVLTQSAQPGIPYAMERGATSIWEQFFPDSHPEFRARSLNHFAYGSVCENFWRHIAGIAPDADEPGFRRVILAPQLTNVIAYAAATYGAPMGEIRSAWKRDASGLSWQITLPRGARGRAIVPIASASSRVKLGDLILVENGEIRDSAAEVTVSKLGEQSVEIELAAGCWDLQVEE